MAQAAYLRVYLPPGAVERPVHHVAPNGARTPVLVRSDFGVYFESIRDDAFVVEHEGERYVCPRTPRLRMLEGLIAFRNAAPAPTSSMLVPDVLADRASQELERLQVDRQRSHILTSPFYVPLRWFAAFAPAERELVQAEDGLTIRYRTRLGSALRRLTRAVGVLEEAGFDDPIIDQVRDVVSWMESFTAEALLELDYGGVAGFFSDMELALDETAHDVSSSLEALENGDFDKAGTHYADAASRWAAAQALTYAN